MRSVEQNHEGQQKLNVAINRQKTPELAACYQAVKLLERRFFCIYCHQVAKIPFLLLKCKLKLKKKTFLKLKINLVVVWTILQG